MGGAEGATVLVVVSLKTCCLRNYLYLYVAGSTSRASSSTVIGMLFILGNYIKYKLSLKTLNI